MTEIELSEKFKSQLTKLKAEEIRERVEDVLKEILSNPNTGKPLRYTLKGFRAIRIGKYRLIYAIEGDAVKVYAIEHRKKVYE